MKHLWGVGARFARWYDPPTFKSRIVDRTPMLAVEVFHVDNAAEIHPDCYPYFAVFEKRA